LIDAYQLMASRRLIYINTEGIYKGASPDLWHAMGSALAAVFNVYSIYTYSTPEMHQ
jgi:hypothetical protein